MPELHPQRRVWFHVKRIRSSPHAGPPVLERREEAIFLIDQETHSDSLIMIHAPKVSVIVPAYKAGSEIRAAISSVERCGLPSDACEIIIASDDGFDYRQIVSSAVPLRFSEAGPIATGPGAARNRALALARGEFAAFLDSDDTWEPDYLAQLVPLAIASGLAFGRSSILAAGKEVLRLPPGATLTFADIAESGASFHPVLCRQWAGPFSNRLSEDILHAVEALALGGGGGANVRCGLPNTASGREYYSGRGILAAGC